ncbi:MAG: hypothetical protein ACRDBY_08670 [Cetobacterium sp.]
MTINNENIKIKSTMLLKQRKNNLLNSPKKRLLFLSKGINQILGFYALTVYGMDDNSINRYTGRETNRATNVKALFKCGKFTTEQVGQIIANDFKMTDTIDLLRGAEYKTPFTKYTEDKVNPDTGEIRSILHIVVTEENVKKLPLTIKSCDVFDPYNHAEMIEDLDAYFRFAQERIIDASKDGTTFELLQIFNNLTSLSLLKYKYKLTSDGNNFTFWREDAKEGKIVVEDIASRVGDCYLKALQEVLAELTKEKCLASKELQGKVKEAVENNPEIVRLIQISIYYYNNMWGNLKDQIAKEEDKNEWEKEDARQLMNNLVDKLHNTLAQYVRQLTPNFSPAERYVFAKAAIYVWMNDKNNNYDWTKTNKFADSVLEEESLIYHNLNKNGKETITTEVPVKRLGTAKEGDTIFLMDSVDYEHDLTVNSDKFVNEVGTLVAKEFNTGRLDSDGDDIIKTSYHVQIENYIEIPKYDNTVILFVKHLNSGSFANAKHCEISLKPTEVDGFSKYNLSIIETDEAKELGKRAIGSLQVYTKIDSDYLDTLKGAKVDIVRTFSYKSMRRSGEDYTPELITLKNGKIHECFYSMIEVKITGYIEEEVEADKTEITIDVSSQFESISTNNKPKKSIDITDFSETVITIE